MESTVPVASFQHEMYTEILKRHARRDGALMPIIHDIQHALGFIPPEAVGIVADALNLSRAEVHGAISFYHDFRQEAPGRNVLKLCQAEACQARGGRQLTAAVRSRLGVELGETTGDGAVTLEAVYCLGLCASGPAALINGQPLGRLDAADLDSLVGAWR